MIKEKQTPLVRQYSQIKAKYPDTILLFRMGDFYETFNEDAEITSKVCGIVLTKRNNGGNLGDMPLAGFPYHQLDTYLPKLVRAGYRVAVCEQLEDPKQARGIVKRDVIEVVTPGVAFYDKLLDSKANNYVAGIYIGQDRSKELVGYSFADISTGEFFTFETDISQIIEVIETFQPFEILISKGQKQYIEKFSNISSKPAITKLEPWIFDTQFGREALLGQFKTQNLKGFGIEELRLGIAASGAVLYYINETQKIQLSNIKKISAYNYSENMILDNATRRNLEITYSGRDNQREGTLIAILDKTNTPMGGRLLKKWISHPLLNINTIKRRLLAVRALYESDNIRQALIISLKEVCDLERIISKICIGRAITRDLIALKNSLKKLPEIRNFLFSLDSETIKTLAQTLNPLPNVVDIIEEALVEEPSIQFGSGNIFKRGFSKELDLFIEAKKSGKNWISEYQEKERSKTDIPSLKVSFNSVFGYYIEVTKPHLKKVPDYYERKQTLVNAERFTTKELKEIETKILNAEERITELEQTLFTELRMKIALETATIQDNAYKIAVLDCLLSFAEASKQYNYCEPTIDNTDEIEIKEGRHPVVERYLQIGEKFTPNSTFLSPNGELIHIITGPNMSGKSVYLRQVALIVLLGQIGCYVPAKSARFGIVDRIFTRVGAQDNIVSGESTFLVEMQESANILNNASSRSLILLDEVGRGTATFDGISIAWAIAEYIHNNIGAKTLFATHYHELNDLASRYENIVNYSIEVIESNNTVVFTHNVRRGSSDHSFGIHVAQIAGLPKWIIERANTIMKALEESGTSNQDNTPKTKDYKIEINESQKSKKIPEQLTIFEFKDDAIRERIAELNINQITPVEALNILAELHKEVKRSKRK